jgi:ATP-binding cassette subfamily B protein
MKKMMDHSQVIFQNHFAGNLANKIKDVMSGVPDLLRVMIYRFFSHSLACVLAILTVWTVHYKFSALLATWILIFVLGTLLFIKRAKELSITAADVRSGVVGQLVDIISNMTSIHLFSGKKLESKKLKVHLDNYVKADQTRDWWFLKMFAFQGFSFVLYQVACFVFLILGFKNGSVTAGDFALLLTINVALIQHLSELAEDILSFAEITGNITQGLQVALAPLDILDKLDASELEITQGQIMFNNVHFNYKGTEALFNNKSVIIQPGQKVGLVGYSGSGKTTFVNLILRLYEISSGEILIDGQDILEVTQDSLHRAIGMIPQDPALFHRSLMENIRYGDMDARDEAVKLAAQKAHAHEFIIQLPQGYDALVGERGVKLSGGQRQRIAIARAVLKNAPILLLDEATSQLDSVTESKIQASLWDLMQGKTTIVIAHRLSTLLHMDRILVFDQGKIIEDGSHQALLAANGLYKSLWEAQVGGFLPEQQNG